MFKKNKSSLKKKSSLHKNRFKKNCQPKSKASLLFLAASCTCQANAQTVFPAVSAQTAPVVAQKIDFRNNNVNNFTMNNPRASFKKFRDNNAKKPLKRLNETKKLQQSYSQKLANSIKRRALNRNNLPSKPVRKLDFQAKSMQQKQQQQQRRFQLPKPKFYRNKKQSLGSRTLLNTTIEDGEIIEEIESSDDDDCIVVEAEVDKICLDDDSQDDLPTKQTAARDDSDDEMPSCSRFEVDTQPQKKLHYAWSKTGGRGAMYAVKASPKMSANDSCIIIDDSYCSRDDSPVTITDDRLDPNRPKKKESVKKPLDDSVIFVEEDFIPLPKDSEEPTIESKANYNFQQVKGIMKGVKMVATPQNMIRDRMSSNLFTTTERKKIAIYNSNTYNPGREAGSGPISNKRSIIIDGSNVAFGHGLSQKFSAEGIKMSIEHFVKLGHEVKAVIPLYRRNATKSTNPALLDQLFKEGKIVFTPCKNLPNQQSISYDDRFILQLAYEMNAAVVSNDNYRDLIDEMPAFKKIIENRVIGYSWCDNIFILPQDPYGRFGPKLDEILRC